jgi:hypothetical protein
MVRMVRGRERVVKFFNDAKYLGKRNAQQAAKKFRDETLMRFQREGKKPRAQKIVSSQKRNRSGVIGVCRVERKRKDGATTAYYAVSWRSKAGVQNGTTISINKYGEEAAFKKACAIRNQNLMKRFGSGVFRKIAAIRENSKKESVNE